MKVYLSSGTGVISSPVLKMQWILVGFFCESVSIERVISSLNAIL